MKVVFAVVLAFLACLSAGAQAETVILLPDGVPMKCDAYRQCLGVANDAGLSVNTSMQYIAGPNPGYPQTTVTIDGIAYSGRMPEFGTYNVFSGALTNSVTGDAVQAALLMHSTSRRINMGRAHYYITTWYLDSGSIVRP